jgi:predicted LPLAT superfamily acyltransferase
VISSSPTAHLGNWEFASRLLERHGRPIHIARAVETNNPSEMMLRNLMTNDLLQTVDLADRFAPLRLLHALRNNEIVAMQGDRIYQDPGAEVEFFGRTARFPLGPFVLAHVARAPVLPALAIRKSWLKYRLIVGAPIILDPSADREMELRAALLQAVRFLETNLKTCPEQWLNFFDFWQQGSVRRNG